jgi:hypothetical protein
MKLSNIKIVYKNLCIKIFNSFYLVLSLLLFRKRYSSEFDRYYLTPPELIGGFIVCDSVNYNLFKFCIPSSVVDLREFKFAHDNDSKVVKKSDFIIVVALSLDSDVNFYILSSVNSYISSLKCDYQVKVRYHPRSSRLLICKVRKSLSKLNVKYSEIDNKSIIHAENTGNAYFGIFGSYILQSESFFDHIYISKLGFDRQDIWDKEALNFFSDDFFSSDKVFLI